MSEDQKQAYRLRLGPVVSSLMDSLPDQSPASLDAEVQRLLLIQNRADHLEAERVGLTQNVNQLSAQLGSMAKALTATSASVDNITNLIDHRTREIQKLMLHISTLVGTTMTEGAERERLHTRSNDIFVDLSKQMEALSTLVKDQQRSRQRMVENAVGRSEEERLSIADPNRAELDTRPVKARGMER